MDLTDAIQLPSGLWGSAKDIAGICAKDKVRALVLSDSHFYRSVVSAIISEHKDVDILIFCGDGIGDIIENAADLPPLVAFVRGNNDPGTYPFAFGEHFEYLKVPRSILFSIADVPVLLTHGDSFSFFDPVGDSVIAARMEGASVVLSGHTHRSLFAKKNGILCINPGSVSRPRGCPASFAILDFERGRAFPSYEFFKIEANGGNSSFLFKPFTPKEFIDDWLL